MAGWTFDAGGESRPVVLPRHFDDLLPDAPGRYTLHTTVALPEGYRGRDLLLDIPHLAALVELRVGGEAIREDERPRPASYRAVGPHSWTIGHGQATGSVELELVVDHRWDQSAWFDTVPTLRPAAVRDVRSEIRRTLTTVGANVALGTLLPIGFAYLVMFLLDRRRVAGAWFSLQALSGSFYAVFVLGLGQSLFGVHDVAVLALTQVIAPVAGLRLTFETFSLGRPPRVFDVMMVAGGIAAALLAGPFHVRPVSLLVIVLGTLTLGYHLVRLGQLVRVAATRRKARILFVAWSGVALGLVVDGPMWLGTGELLGGMRLACWGLTLNALCQAVVLVADHVSSLHRTDELNEELVARIAELELRDRENARLTGELRHQVADKSEALARALARLPAQDQNAAELRTGDVIDGRYRVERHLGSGGMGSVYEASRLADGRPVALKVIKHAPTALRKARFAREAMMGAKVAHPNVVTIIDVGIDEAGTLFLVMELVEGQPLGAFPGRPLSWILSVCAQAARGLAAIHAADVVHRDLKPSNILVDERSGTAKITDFGISVGESASSRETPDEKLGSDDGDDDDDDDDDDAHDEDAPTVPPPERRSTRSRAAAQALAGAGSSDDLRLTATGASVGTPLYAAPEARGGGRAGKEADVYALCLVVVEMLAGAHPSAAPDAVARALGRLGPEMRRLLDAGLSLEPSLRPGAAELADALAREADARTPDPIS